MAFLLESPINPGHTLLVPRRHVGGLTGLPPAELTHLMALAPHLAQAVARALDYDGYNVHIADSGCAGQIAEHAAIHLIPRLGTDGFYWNWRRVPFAAGQPPATLAARVRERLPQATLLQQLLADTGDRGQSLDP